VNGNLTVFHAAGRVKVNKENPPAMGDGQKKLPPDYSDGEFSVMENLTAEIISHLFSVVKRNVAPSKLLTLDYHHVSGVGSPALTSGVSSPASTATAATRATLSVEIVPYKDETGGRGWHTGFCSSWSERTVSSINAGGCCRQLVWSRVVGGSR
jgi:hypothetical protein